MYFTLHPRRITVGVYGGSGLGRVKRRWVVVYTVIIVPIIKWWLLLLYVHTERNIEIGEYFVSVCDLKFKFKTRKVEKRQ